VIPAAHRQIAERIPKDLQSRGQAAKRPLSPRRKPPQTKEIEQGRECTGPLCFVVRRVDKAALLAKGKPALPSSSEAVGLSSKTGGDNRAARKMHL
jgi:hypothetical protein